MIGGMDIISPQSPLADLQALRTALLLAQFALAQQNRALLIIVAGTDHVACEETVDRLHEWFDARFIDAAVFDEAPPPGPPLQRYWLALPQRGRVGIHYGGSAVDLITARCEGRIDGPAFATGIARERDYVRQLIADGMVVLPIWLERRGGGRGRRKDGDWKLDATAWPALENGRKARRVIARYHAAWIDGPVQWHVFDAGPRDGTQRDAAILTWLVARMQAARTSESPSAPARPLPAPWVIPVRRADAADAPPAADYFAALGKRQARLHRLSGRARAAGLASLVLFEGWDAAGKGGAIRRLVWAMNAANYRVAAIGAPNDRERGYPYLWRFWTRLPRPGRMVILDRSWYGRVLVERVEDLIPPADWQRAYAEITDFEAQLTEAGIVLVKIWLEIDADEQLRRFQERQTIPYKQHKIGPDDWRNHARRADYARAIDDMLARTDSPAAPWTVIPANDKRAARLAVFDRICAALRTGLKRGPGAE